MRLGIDLDGVVANFTKGWVDHYNRRYGTSLEEADSRAWGDMVRLTHFASMGEFWRWSSDIEGHSLFRHLDPYPGAVDALRSLDEQGHQVVIITTKPHFAVDDTHEWISEHGLPASEVHILADKWTVECDVYLDDGPHILPELVARRPDKTVCRYVRPWNEPLEGAEDIHDFYEFERLVGRLAGPPGG